MIPNTPELPNQIAGDNSVTFYVIINSISFLHVNISVEFLSRNIPIIWYCAQSCLTATFWTVVCQAPLSMGFSRQEY